MQYFTLYSLLLSSFCYTETVSPVVKKIVKKKKEKLNHKTHKKKKLKQLKRERILCFIVLYLKYSKRKPSSLEDLFLGFHS